MTRPKVTRPTDLAGARNGELPASLLSPVTDGHHRDDAHHLAARAWRAMAFAAALEGVRLRMTDAYRPLARQRSLFAERYHPVAVWRPGARRWNGSWWVLVRGAPVATPGTSNHGWGLSFDLAADTDDDPAAEPIDPWTLGWLRRHASAWGFLEDVRGEPWHWTYAAGDAVPPAVLAHELDTLPPTPEEDTMGVIAPAVRTDPTVVVPPGRLPHYRLVDTGAGWQVLALNGARLPGATPNALGIPHHPLPHPLAGRPLHIDVTVDGMVVVYAEDGGTFAWPT